MTFSRPFDRRRFRGHYYDSTRPSALETLPESEKDVLEGLQESVGRARRMLLSIDSPNITMRPI